MRRGLIVVVLAAVWAPVANACDIQAAPLTGPAPLAVTYTALCDATTYHWSFADGATADGKTVTHTFAAGRWSGTLTGDEATPDPLPRVTAVGVTLTAPGSADYAAGVPFSGKLTPAPGRVRLYRGADLVTAAATGPSGRFRITARLSGPGPYTVRAAGATSAPVTVVVRPVLSAHIVGHPTVGRPLAVVARLRPATAGTLRVQVGSIAREGRTVHLRLDTTRPGRLHVRVQTLAADGYAAPRRTLDVAVVYPDLADGAAGSSVRELEQLLSGLHYALLGTDATYGADTVDAVIAFQKLAGLPRTGRVDEAVWARLVTATAPKPRFTGPDHLEVDKEHQVLLVVRGGAVVLIAPVSTAGLPGRFTPVGRFAVYRKVAGFDPSPLGTLYDPLYFTGGYAIHGNPSVPPYPASHGCVRVPMWVAPRLFATIPYGEPVYVY